VNHRQIDRLRQFQSAEVMAQGERAFRDGLTEADCPYKWSSNSRAGDFKRAWWNAGYRNAKQTAQTIR
jgi:hypothetical protein